MFFSGYLSLNRNDFAKSNCKQYQKVALLQTRKLHVFSPEPAGRTCSKNTLHEGDISCSNSQACSMCLTYSNCLHRTLSLFKGC